MSHFIIYHFLNLPDSSNQSVPNIPVAPPPNIANPEKEVSKCVIGDGFVDVCS